MSAVLQVTGLETGYNRDAILRGIDFALGSAEVLSVLGHNGAGKSSLVRCLIGLLPVWRGGIAVNGADLTRASSTVRVAAGLAVSFQDENVFPTLSVERNLNLGAYVRWNDQPRVAVLKDKVLRLFPKLRERASQRAYTLSGGERRMLSIGMALMSDPSILILDEPSTGLSPLMTDTVFETIVSIRDTLGKSVILVEQNVEHALGAADRVLVLKTGQIIYDGLPGGLATDSTELVMMF